MIASRDAGVVERARKRAQQAREPVVWYEHRELGYNHRMSNLVAAVGVGQLEALERILEKAADFEWYRSGQRAGREADAEAYEVLDSTVECYCDHPVVAMASVKRGGRTRGASVWRVVSRGEIQSRLSANMVAMASVKRGRRTSGRTACGVARGGEPEPPECHDGRNGECKNGGGGRVGARGMRGWPRAGRARRAARSATQWSQWRV